MVNKRANGDVCHVGTKSLLITNLILRISPSKVDTLFVLFFASVRHGQVNPRQLTVFSTVTRAAQAQRMCFFY